MPSAIKSAHHIRAIDVRDAAKLAVEATHGVTLIAESVHQAVWATLGAQNTAAPTTTRGLTGFVYRNIHRVTALVGNTIDLALAQLTPIFTAIDDDSISSDEREAVIAALNGVMGDRLAATHNSLATKMTIRANGVSLDLQQTIKIAQPKTKIILFIHGLCMNDLQWRSANHAVDYDASLADALNATPLYLRYNTGLSICDNGRALSEKLTSLVAHWPVKISDITIIAHSMGGLVARSACQIAEGKKSSWRRSLKNIIFLGTPHHGAPLERIGHLLDLTLASNQYSRAFTKLTKLRSQGVVDLRTSKISEDDVHIPLPANVNCYVVAATTASSRSLLVERLIGDGLVPLNSALGQSNKREDKLRALNFEKTNIKILTRTNHMALLGNRQVLTQLIKWLT